MRISFLIMVCWCVIVSSKAQFKVDAQLRVRSEYRDGVKALMHDSQRPAWVTAQRTRLNFQYHDERVEFYISFNDARVWGESEIASNQSKVGLYQAYVKYGLNSNFNIKVGRQVLNYDKKRLLADKNWNTAGASHDIALMQFKSNKLESHLGLAYGNDSDRLFESDYSVKQYKYLIFWWWNYAFNNSTQLSIMNIVDGNQKKNDYKTVYARATSGFLLTAKEGCFSFDLSSYVQYGKHVTGQKIMAYLFQFSPSVEINEALTFSVGYERLSGSDATQSGNKYHAFSTLYGSGHTFHGSMDYFTDIPKHTLGGGLQDAYFKTAVRASEKIIVKAALHNFRLANKVLVDDAGDGSKTVANCQLGTEMDLTVLYKFFTNSDLTMGYSTLMPSPTMALLKGGDSRQSQHWIYLSVRFNPELFKTEKK